MSPFEDWPTVIFWAWATVAAVLVIAAPRKLRKVGKWDRLGSVDMAFLALLIIAWPAMIIADVLGFLPGRDKGER